MKKALLIGINYINTNVSLQGCIDDIINMRNVLQNNYLYDSITMLRDDITTNPNLIPTRSNILSALNALILASSNCSEIWIHYSGHGARIRDINGDEASGYDSMIVPVDYLTAGFIIDDDLYSIIRNSKCKTIILADSCNSGTVIDLPWSFNYVNPYAYNIIKNNKYVLANNEIYMLSGCRDNQTSADVYSNVLQQAVGAFTDAFLTCLKKMNYQSSLLLLYRAVCMYLQQNGFTQIPVYSSSVSNPMISTATLSLPPKPIQNVLSSILTTKVSSTNTNTNANTKSITNTRIKMLLVFI
jgi:hypothetical protein